MSDNWKKARGVLKHLDQPAEELIRGARTTMTNTQRPEGLNEALIEVGVQALQERAAQSPDFVPSMEEIRTGTVKAVIAAVRPAIEREAKRAAYRDWLAYLDSSWTAGAFTSEGIGQRKEREYVQTKLAALEATDE